MGIMYKTLSALARIDSGTLTIDLAQSLYTATAVQAALPAVEHHCHAEWLEGERGGTLTLAARDPRAARLQIGMALNELLRCSLQHR